MTPEQEARQDIDKQLEAAGWTVQDYKQLNLGASLGVAIREFPLKKTGFADYLLFVDRKAVGVIEAKSYGTTLSGVELQTEKYARSVQEEEALPQVRPLRFVYESTGLETHFADTRDPDYRSRRVFAFHKPETFKDWLAQEDTLRARLKVMPALSTLGLRGCQIDAITNLERSFAGARPRALIQMATGSGKTFTAVSFVYRLIKFANAKRVLFLVDRSNLGRQTLKEFQQYVTPDDGRKFTELYNVQHLTSNTLDPVNRVCITTIQRLYSMLSGEPELDLSTEEISAWERSPEGPAREVSYNPKIPIETFDIIITDECHRSIYNLWRQVLEYFDAFIIGLTATPSKQTLGFFEQNLVMEYPHDRAVADGVNVGFEIYRIKTKITEEGSVVKPGVYIPKRDKLTRKQQWEELNEELHYSPSELDRSVVAVDQIRTILRTFHDKLFTEIFPHRKDVPKTLIFAKSDSHAEDIVHIAREVFEKGNEFCRKITYKTTGESPEALLASFRNSYNPRIAVTVDMISTGTDIKPLECLLFMRDVKSRVYYEQMLGRGTRTISPTDFNAVTRDAPFKTHFVVVDAVGVTETAKIDPKPLDRTPSTSFEVLLRSIALGSRNDDTISSFVSRLTKLDEIIDEANRQDIESAAGGRTFKEIINALLDSIDPDKHEEKAQVLFETKEPSDEQLGATRDQLIEAACKPFDDPTLREAIKNAKTKTDQWIDQWSIDEPVAAGWDAYAKENALSLVQSFEQFIQNNKDEIIALQLIYSKPYRRRGLNFQEIKELANALQKQSQYLNPEVLWKAYEQLDKSRVRGAGTYKILTDIISLVRYAIGEDAYLEPFSDFVNERFDAWISNEMRKGNSYSREQMEWLTMIKDHIAASVSISPGDFDNVPFEQRGGRIKAWQLFGNNFDYLLGALNESLVFEPFPAKDNEKQQIY
jgi:type I restriction enzyme R subunit